MNIHKGALYLIPTPLGDGDINQVLPDYNRLIIMELDTFVVEELRTARRFLRKIGYTKDFEEVNFFLLNEHTQSEELTEILQNTGDGKSVGLLSEAGCPAIADPGASLVNIAHQAGIKVIPLTGPSSIILALMASGLNGQQFTFNGYLPVKLFERIQKLKELERLVLKLSITQIFIETPYRNQSMFDSILEVCNESTLLCIAINITMPDEIILTKSIKEWRRFKFTLEKKPAVFLLG